MFRKSECPRMHYDYGLNEKLHLLDERIMALEPKPAITWRPGYGSYVGPYVRTSTEARLQAALAREAVVRHRRQLEATMATLQERTKERDEARLELDISRQTAQAWRIDSDASLDKLAASENKNTELKRDLAKAADHAGMLAGERNSARDEAALWRELYGSLKVASLFGPHV